MAPGRPKIYHITHVNNLPQVIADGGLVCDVEMIARGGPQTTIGMSNIKARRSSLPVHPHPGTSVGDYVPFYFCPRSIMLYVIHCANHPDLAYSGGQESIVHLECDLHDVVERARHGNQRWAFTSSNAGARYTQFYDSLDELDELAWDAIQTDQWGKPAVKEMKQAEFLLHREFPWDLVERIGVRTAAVLGQVQRSLTKTTHQPRASIIRQWYY